MYIYIDMSDDEDDVDRMLKEMDNDEVFEKQNESNNVVIEPDEPDPEPVKKPKKKRKALSEERKAQLRENNYTKKIFV